jgi:hypothetical protein
VPENLSSRAVAQRLGLTLEGTLRESWEHDGRMWDTEVWAVLGASALAIEHVLSPDAVEAASEALAAADAAAEATGGP